MMWIYRTQTVSTQDGQWVEVYQVGYLQVYNTGDPGVQDFVVVEMYEFADKARAAVNYLNGGNSCVEVSGVVHNKT